MLDPAAANPSLVVAVALAAGIVAQSVAQHLRIPGIVALVVTGVLLGPDGAGVVRPETLGEGLHILVGFAIAVILFEGGLNLDWRRLRKEGVAIRGLVSGGALVTWAGGALAARLILGWSWSLSILFGSLVIVTGPTVITPLLRRIKVNRNIETVLEAEGVFIDAVGAIIAVVALEVVLSPSGSSLALGFVSVPTRLVAGVVGGAVGGAVMALLLRIRGVVPLGMENVFTLALAIATFQITNALSPESGIVAVIVAGLVVGNARTDVKKELKEFKEQLTVMLIGMLFVLLAADVRVGEVVGLGAGAFLVVAVLMFVVRPVQVVLCTWRSGMTWRDKAFMSWLAPRGIVAAAVATLFHERLSHAGIAGGEEMRALVFLVIGVTVVFQGLTGGLFAQWIGVRRRSQNGYVVLGAHPLGVALADLLRDAGEESVLIDSNADACRHAQDGGFRVLHGNALDERILHGAEIDTRRGLVATLPNEAVNIMFARRARQETRVAKAYVALQRGHSSFTPAHVHEVGASVLFGNVTDLDLWNVRLARGIATITPWEFSGERAGGEYHDPLDVTRDVHNLVLPIARGDGAVVPVDDRTRVTGGARVYWLMFVERQEDATAWLRSRGWTQVAASAVGTQADNKQPSSP
jgi:NhaP-type Na+/H+ or K+/H+ antiporter